MNKVKTKLKICGSRLKYGLMTLLFMVPAFAAPDNCDPSQATLGADGKLTVCKEGTQNGTAEVFNFAYDKTRLIMTGLMGLGTIIMVGMFAYKAVKLMNASDDPKGRSQAIMGLVFYFIGAALFGASALFAGLGYNLFK